MVQHNKTAPVTGASRAVGRAPPPALARAAAASRPIPPAAPAPRAALGCRAVLAPQHAWPRALPASATLRHPAATPPRRVAPVVSRYTVGRGVRLERWRRLAVAAAEQCGRTSVPAIDTPLPLPELLRAPWPGLRLIAWEGERDVPLTALPAPAEAVVIL